MRDLMSDSEGSSEGPHGEAIAVAQDHPDGGGAGDEAVILLTELPRGLQKRSVMIEVDHRRCVAVIYAPSMGLLIGRSLVRCIVAAIRRLLDPTRPGPTPYGSSWVSEESHTECLLSRRRLSRVRMVLGMVRANRPWRLIPTLTGLTAAAAATASFGIFFSSIWQMSSALSALRLAMITCLSVTLATVWLIVNNRLWQPSDGIDPWRRGLYNAATACTVLFNAVVLYAGLFVATVLAAGVVIEADFMSSQLGHSAGVADYVKLAWLATSMGMVAGGLGSSVDSRDDVLRATYGYRERMRRQRADELEEGE